MSHTKLTEAKKFVPVSPEVEAPSRNNTSVFPDT